MSRVTLTKYGVYCYVCQEVHDDTDVCEHSLSDKAGVRSSTDGYYAKPSDMGHHSPCMFTDVDGVDMCLECDKVKIPEEML